MRTEAGSSLPSPHVRDGAPTGTTGLSPRRVGWTKHVTFDRVLLIALALFNAGRFWQGQQATNESIAKQIGAIELRLTAAEAQTTGAAAIYIRKDVGELWFSTINQRLTNIEQVLRERQGAPR